jgi:hypothetical protein
VRACVCVRAGDFCDGKHVNTERQGHARMAQVTGPDVSTCVRVWPTPKRLQYTHVVAVTAQSMLPTSACVGAWGFGVWGVTCVVLT